MVAVVARAGVFGLKRKFYVNLSLLMALIAIVGFWRSYFGPLLAGVVDRPALIHFHAVIYVGWLLLFIAQTMFAATGHLALHKKLGNFGIGYGVLVILVGLMATFGMFAIRVRAGAADAFLSVGPLLDMLVFAPFFAAAIYYRKKPELHKRLMIVAMTTLLIAAVSRMPMLGTPRNLWLEYFIWISPLLIAMVYDFTRRRLVHPAYITGIIVLALASRPVRRVINASDTWLEVNVWFASVFAA